MMHPTAYRGKQVAVVGMAKSGTAVAKLFHSYGAVVTVNELKPRETCPQVAELESLGIQVVCGHHPADFPSESASLLVKNPGIPYEAPPVARALALGIEVVTEVEVAWQVLATRQVVGITGSNGKTTTTTWIGEALAAAGLPVVVAGNIGRAVSEVVPDVRAEDWLVTELSSFQLMGTSAFAPRIAVLLNFAETHLDYHGTMEAYMAAKARLFASQLDSDYAVIHWDDVRVRSLLPSIRSRVFPFSMSAELEHGVFVRAGRIVARLFADPSEIDLLALSEIGIPGRHNAENALAVAAVALLAGVPLETLRRVLREFRGVEHRLEWVVEKDGIRYYNDSKATNPQATIKAIDGFPGRVVLLAGGLDRGSDYLELQDIFREKVKALVTVGETRDKLVRVARLAGIEQTAAVEMEAQQDGAETLRRAVLQAREFAEPGDIVLLSPACASWDQFPSYEVRGRIFKESVHTLL